jgi:hypothetical protein
MGLLLVVPPAAADSFWAEEEAVADGDGESAFEETAWVLAAASFFSAAGVEATESPPSAEGGVAGGIAGASSSPSNMESTWVGDAAKLAAPIGEDAVLVRAMTLATAIEAFDGLAAAATADTSVERRIRGSSVSNSN